MISRAGGVIADADQYQMPPTRKAKAGRSHGEVIDDATHAGPEPRGFLTEWNTVFRTPDPWQMKRTAEDVVGLCC